MSSHEHHALRGRIRRVLLAGSMSVALVAVAGPASAANTPYGTNLVKNPGAQSGNASSSGNGVVSIPRWDTFANMTVVKYGTSGLRLSPIPIR